VLDRVTVRLATPLRDDKREIPTVDFRSSARLSRRSLLASTAALLVASTPALGFGLTISQMP